MKTVQINSAVLGAIRKLVSNNTGVDITPIVNDICTCEDDRDAAFLRIAAVLNNCRPEVDTVTFSMKFAEQLVVREFMSASLIKESVTYREHIFKVEKTEEEGIGKFVRISENKEQSYTISMDSWNGYDYMYCLEHIKRNAKVEEIIQDEVDGLVEMLYVGM